MPHSLNIDQSSPTNTPDEIDSPICQCELTAIDYIREVLSNGLHDIFFASTTPEESDEEFDETSHHSINVENVPVFPKFIKKRKPGTKEIVDEMVEMFKEVDQEGPFLYPSCQPYYFSNRTIIEPPISKCEYKAALGETIEEPAHVLVSVFLRQHFSLKKEFLVWHNGYMRKVDKEILPSEFQQILNEAKSDNATHQSIEIAKPDGCFEYRRKPILITDHETAENLNEYMCEDFDFLFDEKADLNNSSAIEYQTIKEATEKSPDPGAYRVLYTMTKMYYHMLRYNLTQSYVTSGRCWLFLEIPRDDKRTLAYEYFESKNIRGTLERSRGNDYESLKETAFVKVVSLVLKEAIERFENDDDLKAFIQRTEPDALEDSKESK